LERASKRVLDAAALLNSNFFAYENAIISPSVATEIRSRSEILEALISAGKIRIVEPSTDARERVKRTAERIGEINALSDADIDALALALQENAILVTDDFHVQNVAEELKIKYEGVTGKIKEKRKYVLKCINCGRKYSPMYKGKRCKVCGGKLVYFSNSEFSST